MKKGTALSHGKSASTLHEDKEGLPDLSDTKRNGKEGKESVEAKHSNAMSDNVDDFGLPSTTKNAIKLRGNKTSVSEGESDNESPMVITPQLFKESIHEAIRQFAERMKLGSSTFDGDRNPGVEKGNRIEKSLIENHINTTDTTDIKNASQTKGTEIKRNNTFEIMDESKSNKSSPRLNRLVQFFLSSKQTASASKHNMTFLIDDRNSLMKSLKSANGSEPQEFDTLENVRKSFFGRRDEDDEETASAAESEEDEEMKRLKQ